MVIVEGRTNISESVFIEIAREAMHKVEDVFREERKSALSGLTRIFTERFAPQITVRKSEPAEGEEGLGGVSFEVKLSVVYGVRIPEVAQKVREKIITEVETLTGYKVEKVDIVIDRIVKPEEIQEEKKEKANL
ncbi:Asp23/Gls24 family envelope stress response protein [Thermovorax subterraneus]|nr:Asp23/Gls24 family envelope stress response protein [Thermovorax subterraneus]